MRRACFCAGRRTARVVCMLVLVGLGISSEKDISLAGLEEIKKADAVFAEKYTNAMMEGTLARLEKMTGKKISVLAREQVEGEKEILAQAAAGNAVLLVPGDPMIATTHVSLLVAARKKGIGTKVVHSSSILSAAIGESGLQSYRFGKIVTLAAWRKNYEPTSTIDAILENLERGLHTLVLVDIVDGEPLLPKDALELLLKVAKKAGGKAEVKINEKTKIVLLSRVGWPDQKVSHGSVGELLKTHTGGAPSAIIVPAKLHFLAEEVLAGL
jgi:diphthine synthase